MTLAPEPKRRPPKKLGGPGCITVSLVRQSSFKNPAGGALNKAEDRLEMPRRRQHFTEKSRSEFYSSLE